MEDLYDPEEKILCPYNNSHHIRRCKMSFHLVKCKKNYGEQKMISCDFNATHMIPELELRYHHQVCPDRKKVEAQIVESRPAAQSKFPIPTFNIGIEENWDNINTTSYDPEKYSENHDVLRHLDVESGAKRKNFRFNERLRLGTLTTETKDTPVEPVTEKVPLPPHRPITNVKDDKFNPSVLRQKMQNSRKVFVPKK